MFGSEGRFGAGRVDAAIEQVASEKGQKLQEILDLLLAAGYFRVRIQGLSTFDKVIGGLAWAVTASNFDVDVDVVFQEQSTIGQKIKVSESICKALHAMKCRYPLEPHQIQGEDYDSVFPVLKWLIKTLIETRQGHNVRKFAEVQFSKLLMLPDEVTRQQAKVNARPFVASVLDAYRPRRKFRRAHDIAMDSEEKHVQYTLLEYGRGTAANASIDDEGVVEDTESALAERRKKLEKTMGDAGVATSNIDVDEEMRKHLEGLTGESGSRVSGKTLGRIVYEQSDEIRRAADEYEGDAERLLNDPKRPMLGLAEAHKRQLTSLQRQLELYEKKREALAATMANLEKLEEEGRSNMEKLHKYNDRILREIEKLKALETPENANDISRLKALVLLNEQLKSQEADFKLQCRQQMKEIQAKMEALSTDNDNDEEMKRLKQIEELYEADFSKWTKARQLLAEKNQALALIQRKIDDIPTRTELVQYERRFVELYDQVAAKLDETRKYYNSYNNLDNRNSFLTREIEILDSISSQFNTAMSSKSNKDRFVEQLRSIKDSVCDSDSKVSGRLEQEKRSQTALSEKLNRLIDHERSYFKLVKEFQDACSKNEYLQQEAARAGIVLE